MDDQLGTLSDEELLERAGRGDRAAFRVIYERHRSAVYGYLIRRVSSPALAEDLCQEVFLGLLKMAERWEPRAKVRTLLLRIALNQAANATRRKEITVFDSSHVEAEGAGPEANAGLREQAHRVREAIAALEPQQREALLLNHYQGLSYAEVAEVLDVPVGTIRSRLARAKTALREALRDLLPEEGPRA